MAQSRSQYLACMTPTIFTSTLMRYMHTGLGQGETTGYKNVDELYTIREGQLTVVTGIPSSGKSEFIDQIMVNLAENRDWKFAICSFENEPSLTYRSWQASTSASLF